MFKCLYTCVQDFILREHSDYIQVYAYALWVRVSVCWLDRITEGERVSSSSSEGEKKRERRGVAVQSNAWRLNLFLTELHQC